MNEDAFNAKKYFQCMIRIDSNNITANQYLALINNYNNPGLAKVFTRRLLYLEPGKALYYRNMADIFKRTREKDSALLYYNRAYAMAPNDYKNAVGYAGLLIDKKLYAAADSIIETGLERDSLNILFLKLRIRSAYEAKAYQNAFLPGERLIRIGERSLSALTQLALSYYNINMYYDCIRVCEYMIQNELESESIYYYEAKSFAQLKNFSRSNELLYACVDMAISKKAELYYYNLGANYEALRQFNTAIKQYDSAYHLFKNPLMKYYQGRIYEMGLKNDKLARKYYMQYLNLALPASADEKKAYAYIKSKWSKKKQQSAMVK